MGDGFYVIAEIVLFASSFFLVAHLGIKHKLNMLSGWRFILIGVTLLAFSSIVATLNYSAGFRQYLSEIFLTTSASVLVYVLGLGCALAGFILVVPHLRTLMTAEERAKRAQSYSENLEEIVEHRVSDLAASKEKYRNLFEHARDAMFLVSVRGTYLDVNEATCKMLGYSREELVGTKLAHTSADAFQRLVELREKSSFPSQEVVFTTKNREKISTELSGAVLSFGDRKYYHGIVRDITERKKLEQQLHEYTANLEQKVQERTIELKQSEEKWRNLFEHAGDAIFVETPAGDILSVNSKACELLQYTREELLSLKVKDVLALELTESLPELYRLVKEKGSIIVEGKNRRKDGTVIDVEVSARHLQFGSDEVVLVFARDMSERKRAEEQVRMLAHMVESISECVSVADLEDRIVFVNDAFLKVYAYEKEEILGKHVSILRPSDSEHIGKEIYEQTLKEVGTVSW